MTPDDYSCVNALKSVLRGHKKPEIYNTDHSSQHTGNAFTTALKDHGAKISMDGERRCIDNIFIEQF